MQSAIMHNLNKTSSGIVFRQIKCHQLDVLGE